MLLLAFPDLKSSSGPVADCLEKQLAEPGAVALWAEIAAQDLVPEDEDDI